MDENVLDDYAEELRILFQLDESRIESLISSLNALGANLGLKKFGELTGTNPSTVGGGIRYALAFIMHNYIYHRSSFSSDMSKTKLDKHTLNSLNHLVENLNEKGKEGLNLIYESYRAVGSWPTVAGISDGRVQLKEILNEKNDVLGYLPFLRLGFEIRDENKTVTHSVFTSLDTLYSIIAGLNRVYEDGVESARRYKRHVGDLVILADGGE